MSLESMKEIWAKNIDLGAKWHMNAIEGNETGWDHQGNEYW